MEHKGEQTAKPGTAMAKETLAAAQVDFGTQMVTWLKGQSEKFK